MAFQPVQEEKKGRYGIYHADRAELMYCKYGGQRVVVQIAHDTVVSGQHACCGGELEDVYEKAMAADPVDNMWEMFSRKGAEHEDKYVVDDDVVQPVCKGVVEKGWFCRRRPNIAGIEVEYHVCYE